MNQGLRLPAGPRPVIVLGAARSGTKLLRSIIASAADYAAVAHDVNYIWRYGQPRRPDDVLPPEAATDAVRRFVGRRLRGLAGLGPSDPRSFVEKTVSNSLRLPYVARIVPEASFVHLVRDGLAVTESALRCWQAPPEYGRLASKLIGFPWRHAGGYAVRYARDLVVQRLNRARTAPSWGPRYPGIDQDVRTLPLAAVCARQWRECIERVDEARRLVVPEQWLEVRYESLVADPAAVAEQIGAFLRIREVGDLQEFARKNVRPESANAQKRLSAADLACAQAVLGTLREKLGYAHPVAA